MLLDRSKINVSTTSVVAETVLATIWNYYFFNFFPGIWDKRCSYPSSYIFYARKCPAKSESF